ncbi:MAG: methyltransferase family protein [Armatimonadota bacterium]
MYRLHRRRRRSFRPGATYSLSLPTRYFRWAKGPLYAVVLVHLVVEVLMSASPPAPRALLLAATVIGAVALGLLHWSLEALGPNFAPCDRGILPRELVGAGPYQWLRHPIYVANMLLVLAIAMGSFGPIILAVGAALGFFYAFAIRDEERALRGLRAGGERPR